MAVAPGFGTVDLDGAGGSPAVTFEQVRFYAPTTSAFPTYLGNVAVDACAGTDRCGAPMTFTTTIGGTLTASAALESASASGQAIVYQDLSPNYGGLGVAKLRTNSRGQTSVVGDEEIDAGDRLTLSFAQQVNVVGFHFFEGDHSTTNAGDFGYLSIDRRAWQRLSLFPNYVTNDPAAWYTGKTFEFKTGNQDFYLGAVKITNAVPEPQTVALMFVGLGLLALGARGQSKARIARRAG